MPITLSFPEKSLILLCSAPGCGKTTFARRHFLSTQIVSSDECRTMVSDDVHNMQVHRETFSLVFHIARLRMKLGRLTVIDATALARDLRRRMVRIAREHGRHAAVVVLDVPLETCLGQNKNRDRVVDPAVIRRYHSKLQQAIEAIREEDFDQVYILGEDEIEHVRVSIFRET